MLVCQAGGQFSGIAVVGKVVRNDGLFIFLEIWQTAVTNERLEHT